MNRTEILQMDEAALDKAIAEARDDPPLYSVMAMNEDESGYCASVTPDGPWWSERELREWLIEEQSEGDCLEYHIVKRRRYARYSNDPLLTYELMLELHERGAQLVIESLSAHRWGAYNVTGAGRFTGDQLPVVICRVYLLWREEKTNG